MRTKTRTQTRKTLSYAEAMSLIAGMSRAEARQTLRGVIIQIYPKDVAAFRAQTTSNAKGSSFSWAGAGEMLGGVPAVLEQKTTICCKHLYLLASLKDFSGLGGVYEDKPQRCGRKACSWVKYHDKRGQNQGFSSPECVDEDLRFPPQF